jgi:UDP-glucose 4-epimerase
MAEARSVLVTGGAGFIGSHVCECYRDAGWRVTAIDDLSTGRRRNVPEGVEFLELDIRSDAAAALVRERRFDVVNHHAAQIDVRVSVRDPRLDASVNVDGLLNLLDAARAAEVRRFVFVSSGGVLYGDAEEIPTAETAPKAPVSPYGVTKLTGEHYLFAYRQVHGLEGVSLRYSNVYGPRQNPHGEAGVVAIFCRRALLGEPLTVFGDGEQTRDYVYVGDVARASLLLTDAVLPAPDGIDDVGFNVATGSETSVQELARAVAKAAGIEADVRMAPARAGELGRSVLRIDKIRALGWRPEVEMDAGLRRTLEHVRLELEDE